MTFKLTKVRVSLVAVLLSGFLFATFALAQQALTKPLLGPWVVLSGGSRLGTLMVRGVSVKEGGNELDALFGGKSGVQAQQVQSDSERKLLVALPSGMKISAQAISDSVYEGTATDGAGVTKDVRLVNISARPADGIPAQCAAFHGGWGGTWGMGVGATRLWVLGIDANCNAFYSYQGTSSNDMPATYSNGVIKDGSLAVRCGVGGTCVFALKGDEIWANYTSTSGSNNAVFRRVHMESATR